MWILARRIDRVVLVGMVLLSPVLLGGAIAFTILLTWAFVFGRLGVPYRAAMVMLFIVALLGIGFAIPGAQWLMARPLLTLAYGAGAICTIWLVASVLTIRDCVRDRQWCSCRGPTKISDTLWDFEKALIERRFGAAYDLCSPDFRAQNSRQAFTRLAKSLSYLLPEGWMDIQSKIGEPERLLLSQSRGKNLAAVALARGWVEEHAEHVLRIVITNTPEGLRVDQIERVVVPLPAATKSPALLLAEDRHAIAS